ncbi:MAG: hypothetical protein PPP58_09455 [Natronomonas sp.]
MRRTGADETVDDGNKSNGEKTPTRRRILAGAVASLGGLSALVAAGNRRAEAEIDGGFDSADVRTEQTDGTISRVTIAPSLALSWQNHGDGIAAIDVTLGAAIEDEPGFDVIYETHVEETEGGDAIGVSGDSFDAVDGVVELVFDRRDLTATGDDVTSADFGTVAPGETQTTAVELTLRVDLTGEQGESSTAVETSTFEVELDNPAGEMTVDGDANTGAG